MQHTSHDSFGGARASEPSTCPILSWLPPGARPHERPRHRPAVVARLLLVSLAWLCMTAEAAVSPAIEGLDRGLANRILARADADSLRCDTPRWIVRAWVRDLEEEIKRALRARGHYAPRVSIALEREADCWQINAQVEPGERARLRRYQMDVIGEGSTAEVFTSILERHGLQQDTPFMEADYEALKRAMRRAAVEHGYFDARFTRARVDVWPSEAAADVTLEFATGPRYQFGLTHIDLEPDVLDDRMLARFLLIEPGTFYSRSDIERLRRRLLQAGYFESVAVNARTEDRQFGMVDVDVELAMRPRHEVAGGLGFSTDYGPRLRSSYENRYLNRLGHRGVVRLNLSPVLQELQTDYSLPLRGRDDAWLIFDAGVQREKTDSAETLIQSLGVRRMRNGPWGTRLTESLQLQREDFDVASDDDVAYLVMPGLGLSRSQQTRARPLEIGWRWDAQVRGTSEPVSTTTFAQLYLRGVGALPLGERMRVLGRVEFGTTWAASLSELPTSVRFFAGGDRSVRGYALDALGPTDDAGDVRGGRHLTVASVELERVVRENWSVALFVDSGGAFNNTSDPWSTGIGAGVRWQSPVGPIGLDIASPLDDDGRTIRLHIGVGSTFQ